MALIQHENVENNKNYLIAPIPINCCCCLCGILTAKNKIIFSEKFIWMYGTCTVDSINVTKEHWLFQLWWVYSELFFILALLQLLDIVTDIKFIQGVLQIGSNWRTNITSNIQYSLNVKLKEMLSFSVSDGGGGGGVGTTITGALLYCSL